MRSLIPAMFLALPALAHSADLPHGHSKDWAIPFALVLICGVAIAARRQSVRARVHK